MDNNSANTSTTATTTTTSTSISKSESVEDIFGKISPIIVDQPRSSQIYSKKESLQTSVTRDKRSSKKHSTPNSAKENNKPKGLTLLSASEIIIIEYDSDCCAGERSIMVKDPSDLVIYLATEDSSICSSFNVTSVKNIVLWDLEHLPVARVSYREKSLFCIGHMTMGIYAPADLLIGRIEESQSGFFSDDEFSLKNADNDCLFSVLYKKQRCGSQFIINTAMGENPIELAKIVEKSNRKLKIQFMTKLSVTSKMLLLGFCIGILHRPYRQVETD